MNITEEKGILPDIESTLNEFAPITLGEMEADHLMSRFDEKYVFHMEKLPVFLRQLSNEYKLLTVNQKKMAQYENIYFDTPELKSYHDHHNGRTSRYKIRFRRYNDSGNCFLEVKRKDNRGFTSKERLPVETLCPVLNNDHHEFILQKTKIFSPVLQASLKNSFYRITLVNELIRERVTLDMMIQFKNEIRSKNLEGIVIAEVKQEQHYYESAFKKLMQRERIFPMNISKYCIGTMLTHPGIKFNRFKPKLLTLNKILNGIT